MKITTDKNERMEQRAVLQAMYVDYKPARHDAYVMRYNAQIEKAALNAYMVNRGIINELSANAENRK